ncbi:GlxA family transcriptional regulator [Bradyrhizobium sp. URHC0002]
MHQIWFLAFDRFQLLDVTGPLQVFATANDELRLAGRKQFYDLRLFAQANGMVRSSSGVELAVRKLPPPRSRRIGTIIVPGGPGAWCSDFEHRADTPLPADALSAWIRRAAPGVARVASVCTGAFILARAGLLHGKPVVTHWAACDELANKFPSIALVRDAIYLRHERVWTSAGVTSGIDMALGMVEGDVGREIAMATAKKLVVFFKRPGGQSQFSSALLEQSAGDERVMRLHKWMAENLRSELNIARLAEQVAMAPRTFARFYSQKTGTTPAQAIVRLRLEKACRLIENDRLGNKAIARRCGFGSEEALRRAFVKHLGVPPGHYRERFSGTR